MVCDMNILAAILVVVLAGFSVRLALYFIVELPHERQMIKIFRFGYPGVRITFIIWLLPDYKRYYVGKILL